MTNWVPVCIIVYRRFLRHYRHVILLRKRTLSFLFFLAYFLSNLVFFLYQIPTQKNKKTLSLSLSLFVEEEEEEEEEEDTDKNPA